MHIWQAITETSQGRAVLLRLVVVDGSSWFGTYATPVVLAFAVLEHGGGASQVGFVLAADTIGMLACIPYGGVVADRLPRNVVMCLAEIAAAGFQALAILVIVDGIAMFPWLVVLQGVVGVSRGFFNPAATGLVASLIEDDRVRQSANGLLGTAQALARLGGPAVSGAMIAASGPVAALLTNCGAYALSAFVLATLPRPLTRERPERMLESIRRGWHELRAREWLWLTVAWFSALQCVAQAPLLVLGPEIARRSLQGSAGWGLVLGGVGAGAAAGAALTAFLRPRRPLRPAIAAYALYALPLLALAKPASLPVVVVSAVLAGGSGGFFAASWFTIFQRNVPREAISRISAWDWEASLAGLPLGMVIAPLVAERIGVPLTLVSAAAATVALTGVVARRTSLGSVAASAPVRTERRQGVSRRLDRVGWLQHG